MWFAVWFQYISALQAPTEAAGDNRKTEAPLHFFAWFETSLSGEIEVPDGCAPDLSRVSHLVWPVLWFQSAFCKLYLKQLDTMGRQRLPWIIFSILLLIHFEGKLKFLMGGRPTCVELATWCGLCFGHLWFQSAFCRLYLKQLDTMGRQRLPWIIFTILLLIHFACCKSSCPSMGSWAV